MYKNILREKRNPLTVYDKRWTFLSLLRHGKTVKRGVRLVGHFWTYSRVVLLWQSSQSGSTFCNELSFPQWCSTIFPVKWSFCIDKIRIICVFYFGESMRRPYKVYSCPENLSLKLLYTVIINLWMITNLTQGNFLCNLRIGAIDTFTTINLYPKTSILTKSIPVCPNLTRDLGHWLQEYISTYFIL